MAEMKTMLPTCTCYMCIYNTRLPNLKKHKYDPFAKTLYMLQNSLLNILFGKTCFYFVVIACWLHIMRKRTPSVDKQKIMK